MSDLIDRQNLREQLNEICDKQCPYNEPTKAIGACCASCFIDDVIEIVQKLPSAQQWIPVKERLPEVGEVVLLTIHEIGWNGCEYDSVVSGVYNGNKNHILAWMPQPEPYSERRTDG